MKKSMSLAAVCLSVAFAIGIALTPTQDISTLKVQQTQLFAADEPVVPPPLTPTPPPPTASFA